MRRAAVLVVILAVSGCGTVPTGDSPQVVTRADQAAAAAAAISAYRRTYGLSAVRVDETLTRAAEHQARAMAETGTFSHEAGGEFAARLRRFSVGHRAAAENIGLGGTDVADVLSRWKASKGHDANLLLPAATRIGFVSAEVVASRPKRYWVLLLAD